MLVMMGLRGDRRPPRPYVIGSRKMRTDRRNRVGPRHALVHYHTRAVDFHGRWRARVKFGFESLWLYHRRVTLEFGGPRRGVKYRVRFGGFVVAFLASPSPD